MPLSAFHPAVREWFGSRFGQPTLPQEHGWPRIREGKHTLIAAPTGSGKTFAAFLTAIDSLLSQGQPLPDETQVLYVSPLKALVNDVQKNLSGPLAEIRDRFYFLPEIRVLVRTGDTPSRERELMKKRPPHILVTTPESLYLLLTSAGGRGVLRTVRTVIVDEIHALARDKRGSHLALSLERLEALAGREVPVQRIGLSATQKPIEDIGRFLTGRDRECEIVDAGHLREIDIGVEVPPAPLEAVCSHETWEDIYERISELIREHTTTLVFVNTRKLAERIAARLTDVLGEDQVMSHHGSLSKEMRLDAEQRLKDGQLRALVATASLELGIDVGDVDLVIQVGVTPSIATFLQRVGRSGHCLAKTPKGRLFPLTIDELVCAAALMSATKRRVLDKTIVPEGPLDILAQQVVASCVAEPVDEEELFETCRAAWPYRHLTREDYERVINLHAKGRRALLHRDGVAGRLLSTKRARLVAIQSGGAIADNGDYDVVLEPDGNYVGSVNEDFAIESNKGDIFQLGNTSWLILRVEPGTVRVADAKGQPPTLPFWFGEAPARTEELSAEVARIRDECEGVEWLMAETGVPRAAAEQIDEYVKLGKQALGVVPTQKRIVAERFFDESGGMQVVIHAPFGGRINRAYGLALRKRFCRGFGFELQAAANEEAIVISLGAHTSFDLDDIFGFLHPNTVTKVLEQAVVTNAMFQTRWRWNLARSLMLERMRNGKRVPFALQRMRSDDLLVEAFPQAAACPENLDSGNLDIPTDHPVVEQTVKDCMTEYMDACGLERLVAGIVDGSIEHVAVDTVEPSVFARGILTAQPYSFLDDAPLEERRTQAVAMRRTLDPERADEIGKLDPEAIARVRDEAWPQPQNVEEVHEALMWMGFVADDEVEHWREWIDELAAAKRVVCEEFDGRPCWFAVEAPRDRVEVLRGRLEALGPIESDAPELGALESQGVVLRTRIDGRPAWCERRLLARIHRYTLDRLRREIRPVSAGEFLRFLACWQHVDRQHQVEGPAGVLAVIRQLEGCEIPAAAWENHIFPSRVRGYRRNWLEELTLSGVVVWGRLWGQGASPIRTTPICLLERDNLDTWTRLAGPLEVEKLSSSAQLLFDVLQERGAVFPVELRKRAGLLASQYELGLGELIARGLITCDSFTGLRSLIVPPSRRRNPVSSAGRFSFFRSAESSEPLPEVWSAEDLDFIADRLLVRYGVVFRRLLKREKQPIPWRDLLRLFRRRELQGRVRGGRFVSGFDGEQYALPEAVALMRKVRREKSGQGLEVSAADPLNLRGILTPDERVSPMRRTNVAIS